MADVPELMQNVCGTIGGNYMITEMADDPIKRDYGVYNAYDHERPETPTQVLIASLDTPKWRWQASMSATQTVLETVKGRSVHFPTLVKAARVKRLVFGADGVQDVENDPEYLRPVLVLQSPRCHSLLSTLAAYSPSGVLPVELAMFVGIGITRALGALNRAGFIHRLVSPHSFSFVTPPTLDNLSTRLLITDLSLAMPWPKRPRGAVPFVGTMRYSALSVHHSREQGPSTDIISLIYVVAEMISGKLPWRSIMTQRLVKEAKTLFPSSKEFQRLPHEIRALYKEMMETYPQAEVDYIAIQEKFKAVLKRKDPNSTYELPPWLVQPCED
ncbi:unnamed protein product [Bursaphelenchus xylophilus]|uniref:(pine wood nematode) hypothetical protein n=1 Tax=Bursaphelenchus xylophilus TaxID=6326 RepID=A0A1I7RLR2_BURXY|nr:unnamed protein product [Bursaphelenchus xylophilus]CAG9082671.1 unnamed protein product [Bursaphelenchus xylophilus]